MFAAKSKSVVECITWDAICQAQERSMFQMARGLKLLVVPQERSNREPPYSML
jgi:hypothetical protein